MIGFPEKPPLTKPERHDPGVYRVDLFAACLQMKALAVFAVLLALAPTGLSQSLAYYASGTTCSGTSVRRVTVGQCFRRGVEFGLACACGADHGDGERLYPACSHGSMGHVDV